MSRKIKLKRIDWPGTVAAALLAVALPVFPLLETRILRSSPKFWHSVTTA